MKKWFLVIALAFVALVQTGFAADKQTGNELQRISELVDQLAPNGTSYPFNASGINPTNPFISTGYYFVDNKNYTGSLQQDTSIIIGRYGCVRPFKDSELLEQNLVKWFRIAQGPRVYPPAFWDNNKDLGKAYFRNPANGNYFDNNNMYVDSTDNAFAGPIPIGFGFYFNGIRYDSFYVSTNGLIALSNRRYFYATDGSRFVPPGASSCYDPMSMDFDLNVAQADKRDKSGDGLLDPIADDYGYLWTALGGTQTNNNAGTATGGIRANGGSIQTLSTASNRSALIAPFLGPLHLSQWDGKALKKDDYGRVYYKRSDLNDKLHIFIQNAAFQAGTYVLENNTQWTAQSNLRGGRDQNYVGGSAVVTLNRLDSSIFISYTRLQGVAVCGWQNYDAPTVFRCLTNAGIVGWARHNTYSSKQQSQAPTYTNYQQTTQLFNNQKTPTKFLAEGQDVKFKQWKNALRVQNISFRVRKPKYSQDPASKNFTEEIKTTDYDIFEMLAGEEKLGSMQPVALIQNLTNDVQGPQGVNFVPQDANFQVRFRVRNLVTNRIIYNRLIKVTETCLRLAPATASSECQDDPYNMVRLANTAGDTLTLPAVNNGIPPYQFVKVYFPPFEPNEFVDEQIGYMQAEVCLDPVNPVTKEALGEQWAFDDSARINFFVMRRLKEFKDDFTQFNYVDGVGVPSVMKWVNFGAQVVSGEGTAYNPLPPLGKFVSLNKDRYGVDLTLESPNLLVNRTNLSGQSYQDKTSSNPAGDQVRSFPIDIRNKKGSVISFSVQRAQKPQNNDYQRGWSDSKLVAPEGYMIDGNGATAIAIYKPYITSNKTINFPDMIKLELKTPSFDGVDYIVNVKDEKYWQYYEPVSKTYVSAFEIWGAGGYFTGFDKDNKKFLSWTDGNLGGGMRNNLYDDGIDFEFKRYFVAVPDTMFWSPDAAKSFRFRIRTNCFNNEMNANPSLADDNDDFLVDNVRLMFPSELCDVEVNSIRMWQPFKRIPSSQASEIPLFVKLSNNTEIDAPTMTVKLKIYRGDTTGRLVYCRLVQVPNMNRRSDLEISMPSWNARSTGEGSYTLVAEAKLPAGVDLDLSNNRNQMKVLITFDSVFSYEPRSASNDVPASTAFGGLAQIVGAGLNIFGFNYGGEKGDYYSEIGWPKYTAGFNGLHGAGEIATKFEVINQDTILGYEANFAGYNQSKDDVAFQVYEDANGQPSKQVAGSLLYAYRGAMDFASEPIYNNYTPYTLPTPVVLRKGTYWMSVKQLGETGIELAASGARMGMRSTRFFVDPQTQVWGNQGVFLMIDKDFRVYNSDGSYINNNLFVYSDISGAWKQFMPTVGNPAYAHLEHKGSIPTASNAQTMSRGTWTPMMHPVFGLKEADLQSETVVCMDEVPVVFANFDVAARGNSIDLFWETSSEKNNFGFTVEKRNSGEGDNAWKAIGFVAGSNNSTSSKFYNYTDKNVKNSATYQYRLRQTDKDGTQFCYTSDVVTVTSNNDSELTLEQNSPNPFTAVTNIAFNLPSKGLVRIDIVDVFGNVVKTLVNQEMNAGSQMISWDATNANGTSVTTGAYIYRLTYGEKTLTGKMTLVK